MVRFGRVGRPVNIVAAVIVVIVVGSDEVGCFVGFFRSSINFEGAGDCCDSNSNSIGFCSDVDDEGFAILSFDFLSAGSEKKRNLNVPNVMNKKRKTQIVLK